VLVEVVVLDGEKRVDELLRHLIERHDLAPLLGELTQHRAVGRVDARHGR